MNSGKTWEHPELGTFINDDATWEGHADPDAFSFFGLAEHDEIPDGRIALTFLMSDEDEQATPTDEQVALMQMVLNSAEALGPKIIDALWADVSGTGPDSGMWWHNGLDELNENGMFEEMGEPPVTDKASLLKSLWFVGIFVGDPQGPHAEINFGSEWEPEHGIGVLIRDGEVAGFGYSGEADPFEGHA